MNKIYLKKIKCDTKVCRNLDGEKCYFNCDKKFKCFGDISKKYRIVCHKEDIIYRLVKEEIK